MCLFRTRVSFPARRCVACSFHWVDRSIFMLPSHAFMAQSLHLNFDPLAVYLDVEKGMDPHLIVS